MKKRSIGRILVLAGFLLITMQIASAEIFIGQIDDLYNIGDEFKMNVTLIADSSTTSFFSAVLSCPDKGEVEIYRSAESILSGKQKTISFSGKFDKAIIGNLSGDCFIQSRFAGEEDRSSSFEISSEIVAQANVAKSVYSPDERIYITGTGFKKNGKAVSGFVQSSIDGLGLSVSRAVSRGAFNFSFDVPNQAPANNYIIHMRVYERDSNGEMTNYGIVDLSIKIRQVPRKIELAFDELSANPGEDFYYTILLTDQSGASMNEEAAISIKSANNEIVEKKLVRSGEKNSFSLQGNALPGNWNIESTLGTLKASRVWTVEEIENASFSLSNGTLTVFNSGNVPFNKAVEVTIGNTKETADINLGVGESKKFRVYAPDGNYDLKVYSGNSTTELGTTFLTGDAIALKDFENAGRGASFLIWMVIALLGAFALVYGRTIVKKVYTGRMPKSESYFTGSLRKSTNFSQSESRSARPLSESSGYVSRSGKKEECGIVFVNLRNRQELEQDVQAASMIARIVKEAKDAKAAVKQDERGFICIFSSAKTGIADNALHAIKTASGVERMLLEYNQRHALNINFGIGVNSGEMIVENAQGTHTFYAVGNSIIAAKRAAEKAQEEILISAPAHRKTASIVKTEALTGENLWKVKQIIDREEHKEFLDRFTKKHF